MILECVTVCVGYADILAETIPYNKHSIDRWLIVTEPSDEKTRDLCRKNSLECLLSEDARREGNFNKGRLVERGLQHLSYNGWRLHMDADIALPTSTRNLLKLPQLNEECIYGADRCMVYSAEEWDRFRSSGWFTNALDFQCRLEFPYDLPLGSRWASTYAGYVPIGFFQLWHSSTDQWRGSRIKMYPTNHNDACRSDVQFALQWDRSKRLLLPELIVVHIESNRSSLGSNWNGRKTPPFRSSTPNSQESIQTIS